MAKPNIVIDTNLFVRIVLEDIEKQAEEAEQVLNYLDVHSGAFDTYIDATIISEIVFILHKYYSFSKREVQKLLTKIIDKSSIKVRDVRKECIEIAMQYFTSHSIKWGDALIAANMDKGDRIITFDTKHFKKVKTITVSTPKEFLEEVK